MPCQYFANDDDTVCLSSAAASSHGILVIAHGHVLGKVRVQWKHMVCMCVRMCGESHTAAE